MMIPGWISFVTLIFSAVNGDYYEDYSVIEDDNLEYYDRLFCHKSEERRLDNFGDTQLEFYRYCSFVNDRVMKQSLVVTSPYYESYWHDLRYSSGHINILKVGTFIDQGEILKLSFDGVTINEIETSAFLGLKKLINLNLKGTGIQSVPFNTFHGLLALEELILSDNMIGDTMDSRNFSSVPNLRTLDLNNNQIYYLKPMTFKMQENLTNLFLDNNYITKLEGKLFQFSNFFLKISLSHNNLTEIANDTFQHTPQILDLSFNELSEVKTIFENIVVNIDSLFITHNKIPVIGGNLFKIRVLDASFNSIAELSHLQGDLLFNLYLNNNNISGTLTAGIFSELSGLRELRLDFNQITNLEFGSFSGLDNLNILNISFNSLTTINAKIFQPLKSLNLLLIGGNSLKTLEMPLTKSNLPLLRQIGLNHNPWLCESLSDLVDILEVKGIELVHHAPKVMKITNINGIKCHSNLSTTENTNTLKSLNDSISDIVKDHIQKTVHNQISSLKSNLAEIINTHVKDNLLLFNKTTIPIILTTMQTPSKFSTEKEELEEVTTESTFKTTENIVPVKTQSTTMINFEYSLRNKFDLINQKTEKINDVNERLEKIDVIIQKLYNHVMNQTQNIISIKNQKENESIQSAYMSNSNSSSFSNNEAVIAIKSSMIIIIILLCIVLIVLFYNFYKKFYTKHVKRYPCNQTMAVNELQI